MYHSWRDVLVHRDNLIAHLGCPCFWTTLLSSVLLCTASVKPVGVAGGRAFEDSHVYFVDYRCISSVSGWIISYLFHYVTLVLSCMSVLYISVLCVCMYVVTYRVVWVLKSGLVSLGRSSDVMCVWCDVMLPRCDMTARTVEMVVVISF